MNNQTKTILVSQVRQPLPGISAYDVAVKNGFVGTETEWLESLQPTPTRFIRLVEDSVLLQDMQYLVVSDSNHQLPENAELGSVIEIVSAPSITADVTSTVLMYGSDGIGVATISLIPNNSVRFVYDESGWIII